ncbi:MAG: ATP-grasp domain-containing protein, partial [Nitrospinota bacterium]|nr:ATP-grasp domain-containing protein [Nitrospinota bacterium]
NKAIAALENLRPDLKNMDILPVISSAETIHDCLDKWETYRFCKNHSIPTPETVLYDRENHDIPIEFPLFLKKRTGEGSNNTYMIKTKEQLKELQLDEEYIVQKYIEGTEYTIDALSDFTGEPLSVVPRERLAVRGGEVLKGKTVHNPELVKWGAKIAKILKICGPANIQCIKNRQGNYFFTDINNRFGSGVVLTLAAGVNFPEMLFKLIRGDKVKSIIGAYEENLFMLRYDEAVFTRDPG